MKHDNKVIGKLITDRLGFYPATQYPYADLMEQYAEYAVADKQVHKTILNGPSEDDMKTTLTFSPDEVEKLLIDALKAHGHDAKSVTFIIDEGFPGSRDPRENSQPSFAGCGVVLESKPASI